MKNEKKILKLLSLKNKYILTNKLDSDTKERIIRSLVEAYESITFVKKENYYNVIKKDLEDFNYYYNNSLEQYEYYKNNGYNAIHNMSDLFQSEYYKKHLKFERYHVVEKSTSDKWKMFICVDDTCIRGKFPVLKSQEKEIMNVIFEYMLKYKSSMGKSCEILYFVSPFYFLSYEDIIMEYEKLLKKYE